MNLNASGLCLEEEITIRLRGKRKSERKQVCKKIQRNYQGTKIDMLFYFLKYNFLNLRLLTVHLETLTQITAFD